GRVTPVGAIGGELARYQFHPALSDACGHAMVATTSLERTDGATGGAFVGGGVGEVRLHRPARGNVFWSHATLRTPPAGAARNVVYGDVRVYDEQGALVSETLAARLWYLDTAEATNLLGAPVDWFHAVDWVESPAPLDQTAGPRAAAVGAWLIFADERGLGARIAEQHAGALLVRPDDSFELSEHGATIRVDCPDDYARLLAAVPTAAAIVHLWSLDAGPAHSRAALTRGVESTLNLVHACAATSVRPRVWIVTSGAQAALQRERPRSPLGAALWGLGRTLSAEHPELWGGLIDADVVNADAGDANTASSIAREIRLGGREDKLALRDTRRLVPRLVRHAPTAARTVAVRGLGTYLITGGLGGIGLAVAGWLVERGARDLVLVGRSGLPHRDSWPTLDPSSPDGRRAAGVRALEATGARVDVAALDIAAPGALATHLARRSADGSPPVCGAVHAAGLLDFRALDDETIELAQRAMAAKVDGSLALYDAVRGPALDFLVLCSSTAALLHSPLLGAYAAANSCLDALAHCWRAEGAPALSINWGTWSDVGMVVSSGRTMTGDMLRGVRMMSSAQGLSALGAL
ncbi:MAG: KR domain-containing protein, partial [Gemmatimonadaceae bacterium]